MAEETKEQTEGQAGASSGNKTLLIFAIVSIVLMIGVGAGAYFLGLKASSSASASVPAAESRNKAKAVNTNNELGPMVSIDEFLINLLGKNTNRYLKATMTLEVDSDETHEEIQTRMPQVRDAILLLTGNKTFDELHDLQGKMQLRTELIKHLNTLLQKGEVKHIYITNFVIQ